MQCSPSTSSTKCVCLSRFPLCCTNLCNPSPRLHQRCTQQRPNPLQKGEQDTINHRGAWVISASFDETVSLLPTYLYTLLPYLSLLSSTPSFLYRCAVATPARMIQLPPSPPTHTEPTVFGRIRLLSLISDLTRSITHMSPSPPVPGVSRLQSGLPYQLLCLF